MSLYYHMPMLYLRGEQDYSLKTPFYYIIIVKIYTTVGFKSLLVTLNMKLHTIGTKLIIFSKLKVNILWQMQVKVSTNFSFNFTYKIFFFLLSFSNLIDVTYYLSFFSSLSYFIIDLLFVPFRFRNLIDFIN